MTERYIVATDDEIHTRHQLASLYRLEGYRSRAVLAAQGTFDQMQDLADDLNRDPS